METTEINTIRMKLGISTKLVGDCIRHHTAAKTLELLQTAEAQFETAKAKGGRLKSGTRLFCNLVDGANADKEYNKQFEEVIGWRETRDREHEAGFRPTSENLRIQLDKLYKTGQIFEDEYKLGINGIKFLGDLKTIGDLTAEDSMKEIIF